MGFLDAGLQGHSGADGRSPGHAESPDYPATDTSHIATADRSKEVALTGNGPRSPENAAYIVAACNALPALLDRLDKAEAALTVKQLLGRWNSPGQT